MTERPGPLSGVAATALVVANMIGVGIFTTTGYLAGALGGAAPVLAVWAVGGVAALCGASVYGELGAMMPRAGGEYVYLSRAFHPAVGFLSGWVSLLVGFSAPIAAAAVAFGTYLHAVEPALPVRPAACALIAAVTALHMADVLWGARVQTWFSALKVLLIAGFVGAGFAFGRGDWANLSAGRGLGGAFGGTFAVQLVWVSFAYSGWNAAAYVAGELRDPQRALPRALLAGTALVMVLYLGLNLVFFYAAPAGELAGALEVGDRAAHRLFGPGAGRALSGMIALALISSVSAMVMAGPRVYAAMAEDGLFFRALARRSGRGAPWLSVALQGVLASALVLTATFADLITFIGFTLSLFAALTVAGAFVLRRRAPAAPRPYRTFGWPVTPLLFLALSLWMAVYTVIRRPEISLAGFGTIAAGLAVYLAWPPRDGY